MKKFTLSFIALTGLLFTGCDKEKYVALVEDVMPKTVMIYHASTVEIQMLPIPGFPKIPVDVLILGSGVFVSPDGHVLTAEHLLIGKTKSISVVLSNGDTYAAEVLAQGKNDLALLKINPIDGPTEYAKIADPRKLKVGQEVIAIGNPKGLDFSVCHGIISALNRDTELVYNATQSDAMINPGNSGGPLFNLKGELVGINSFVVIADPRAPVNTGLGFSVQSGQIVEFLTSIRKKYAALPVYNLDYFGGR